MELTEQGSQPANPATAPTQGNPGEAIQTIEVELPYDPAGIAAELAKTKSAASTQEAGEEEEKKKGGKGKSPSGGTEEENPGEQVVEDPDADLVIEGEPESRVKRILPNRISTVQFSDVEQEAIALRRQLKESGEDVPPLKEAIEIVELRRAKSAGQKTQATETTQTQTDSQEGATQQGDPLTQLNARRAELIQQRRQVAEADPFDAAIVDLDMQLEAVRDEISELRAFTKLQQQQQEKQQQEQAAKGQEQVISARETVKQQALAEYPSAGDANSTLGREVTRVIAELNDPAHPDHAMLYATRAPRLVIEEAVSRIADRVSKSRGVSREQVIATLKSGSSSTPVPEGTHPGRPPVRPVSGAQQSAPPPKTLAGTELLADVGFDPKKIAQTLKTMRPASDGNWVVK